MLPNLFAIAFLCGVHLSEADVVRHHFVLREAVVNYYRPTVDLPNARRQFGTSIPAHAQRHCHLVNDQYPGPLISAFEGDDIEVTVENQLLGCGTSIHWHGVHQRGTPQMDGAWMFSQCALAPLQSVTYRFKADPVGTKWWHSHIGGQHELGVAGPLIIRSRNDPFEAFYSEERLLMLTDWWRDPIGMYVSFSRSFDNWELGLINGQWGDGSADYPYPLISVRHGRCYRLRMINMSGQVVGFTVRVAGHSLTVIALDGTDVVPLPVGSVSFYTGERVDALLCADQPVGNYLVNVSTHQMRPYGGVAVFSMYAFLQYEGADDTPQNVSGTGGGLRPAPQRLPDFDTMKNLSAAMPLVRDAPPPADPSATHTLKLGIRTGGRWYASERKEPFDMPLSPLLHTQAGCGLKNNTEVINVPSNGTVVTLVLDNLSDIPHPMHLHGQSFWILGTGYRPRSGFEAGDSPDVTHPPCSLAAQEFSDPGWSGASRLRFWGCTYSSANDSARLNLRSPVVKDVVVVPSRTWSVIRFVADNPGVWGFHCHVLHHHLRGMIVAFNVAPSSQPPLAPGFPVCGPCVPTRSPSQDCQSTTTRTPLLSSAAGGRTALRLLGFQADLVVLLVVSVAMVVLVSPGVL